MVNAGNARNAVLVTAATNAAEHGVLTFESRCVILSSYLPKTHKTGSFMSILTQRRKQDIRICDVLILDRWRWGVGGSRV